VGPHALEEEKIVTEAIVTGCDRLLPTASASTSSGEHVCRKTGISPIETIDTTKLQQVRRQVRIASPTPMAPRRDGRGVVVAAATLAMGWSVGARPERESGITGH
jgi:hypothetical protein